MRRIVILSIILASWSCEKARTAATRAPSEPAPPVRSETSEARFYALGRSAKAAFDEGNLAEANLQARELLAAAPRFEDNWNYGNAIQDAHIVLGRIALREGRLEDAKRHLREAGNSPGSPQMNSFGPNMSLAKELLEKEAREEVLAYFEQCRNFWKHDNGALDRWSAEVKAGGIPDFGPNLKY